MGKKTSPVTSLEDLNIIEASMMWFLASYESSGNPLVINRYSSIMEVFMEMWALDILDIVEVGDKDHIKIVLTELGVTIAQTISLGIIKGGTSPEEVAAQNSIMTMIDKWSQEPHILEMKSVTVH